MIAAQYEPEFGPIAGGGYENAATHAFVRAYVGRYGCLPREARRSWGSWGGVDYLPAPPARPLPLLDGKPAAAPSLRGSPKPVQTSPRRKIAGDEPIGLSPTNR